MLCDIIEIVREEVENVYRLKEGMYEKIKELMPNFRVNQLAKKIGIKPTFTSLILNRHRTCSKMTAYCFTKAIGSKYEVNDFFINELGE